MVGVECGCIFSAAEHVTNFGFDPMVPEVDETGLISTNNSVMSRQSVG